MGDDERFGTDGHWIVLVGKEDDSFMYLDPWYSKSGSAFHKTIREDAFYMNYTGIACQIIIP